MKPAGSLRQPKEGYQFDGWNTYRRPKQEVKLKRVARLAMHTGLSKIVCTDFELRLIGAEVLTQLKRLKCYWSFHCHCQDLSFFGVRLRIRNLRELQFPDMVVQQEPHWVGKVRMNCIEEFHAETLHDQVDFLRIGNEGQRAVLGERKFMSQPRTKVVSTFPKDQRRIW